MRGLSHFQPRSADDASMDLADLVPSLKRALAAPGEFDNVFPNSTDADLSGTLTDAVAECQLDGFFGTTVLDVNNEVATPDLTTPQQALVILYAMSRVVTARVANLKNRTHYKAGPTEVDTEQSATVLVQLLKDVGARKKQILDDAKIGNLAHAFQMVDMYIAKSIDYSSPDLTYLTMYGSSLGGARGELR